jgi:hypothetical protein
LAAAGTEVVKTVDEVDLDAYRTADDRGRPEVEREDSRRSACAS